MTAPSGLQLAAKSSVSDAAQFLRRSRSLASLLLTGAMTLLVTAVMRLVWMGSGEDFFGAWMEGWLTTWPIAFPAAYLISPFVARLAARISAPDEPVGLAFGDIEDVSARATAKYGLKVRRPLKSNTNAPD